MILVIIECKKCDRRFLSANDFIGHRPDGTNSKGVCKGEPLHVNYRRIPPRNDG